MHATPRRPLPHSLAWLACPARLACLAWLALAPGRASASELSGALSVARSQGALACPDAEALSSMVASLMGRRSINAQGEGRADVVLDVQLACDDAGCRAQIRASGASQGLRELSDADPNCAGLADALAVTLAVLLDWKGPAPPPSPSSPTASSSAPTVAPTVAPTAPPAPSPAPPASPRAIASPSPPWPITLGVALGGGGDVGTLPSPSGFAEIDLEVGLRALPLRLGVGRLFMTGQSKAFSGGTVEMSYRATPLWACAPFPAGSIEIGGCAGLLVGSFRAEGSGYPTNGVAARTWLMPGVALDVRGSLWRWLGWSGRLVGEVRDRDQTVSVGSLGTAAHLSRMAVSGRLSLVVSFL